MSFAKLQHSKAVKNAEAARRASEQYAIFVAGPYIDVGKTKRARVNKAKPENALRYHLCKHFENQGYIVYLGEDVVLRETGEENFGEFNNAVLFERSHILRHIDALIVLPSSPGSFCETGDWVTEKLICEKTLLVIDQKHRRKKNYINDGVVRLGTHHGATVEYFDYLDQNAVVAACETFLEKVKSNKRILELYGKVGD